MTRDLTGLGLKANVILKLLYKQPIYSKTQVLGQNQELLRLWLSYHIATIFSPLLLNSSCQWLNISMTSVQSSSWYCHTHGFDANIICKSQRANNMQAIRVRTRQQKCIQEWYGTKERQTHMTCLNFREISNARVYMLCLVYMICNSGIMANSQWLRSIRLIFHLQANTKIKVDLEWCWFKKSIFCDVQQVCNNLGQFLCLLQICTFFISKRSYYLVQNWPFLG